MKDKLLVMQFVNEVDCEVTENGVFVDLDSLISAMCANEVSQTINNLGNGFKIAKETLLQEGE